MLKVSLIVLGCVVLARTLVYNYIFSLHYIEIISPTSPSNSNAALKANPLNGSLGHWFSTRFLESQTDH